VADNLARIDKAHVDVIERLDSYKGLLHDAMMQKQNKELELRGLHEKFITLNDDYMNKLKSLKLQFIENESKLKQYHTDFEQERHATSQSLMAINKELAQVQRETREKLHTMDKDLRSQMITEIHDFHSKGMDLNLDLNKRLISQGQQQTEDMKDVRRSLGDLKAMASNLEGEVAALQTAKEALPGRVYKLEQEAKLTKAGVQRVEEVLGLEPIDPNEGLKKSACSGFLSEDMVVRKAWAAWMEAVREAKQKKIAGSIPQIQEMLQMHHKLIESETSKLHSTNDRVQSLEVDHTKLLEELQKLRKSLDLNAGHWKGMTRGLSAAKKTMHAELNALPKLTGSATPRPGSSLN